MASARQEHSKACSFGTSVPALPISIRDSSFLQSARQSSCGLAELVSSNMQMGDLRAQKTCNTASHLQADASSPVHKAC